MTKTPSTRTNGFRIHLVSVPDSARLTGDASAVFRGSATLSDAMLEWLRAGAPKEISSRRTDSVVQGLLMSMNAERWDPYSALSLAHPLRFQVMVDGSFAAVITTVKLQGADLLHLDIADGSGN